MNSDGYRSGNDTEAYSEKVTLIEFSDGKTKTLCCSVHSLHLHMRAYKYSKKFGPKKPLNRDVLNVV